MKILYRLRVVSLLFFSVAMPCGAAITVLHSFSTVTSGTNQDGANPAAGLALSGNFLYGNTGIGGAKGVGTAFAIAPGGSNFRAFHSFTNAPDAANPQGDLLTSGNSFFGTSFGGGANGAGTVFLALTNGPVSRILNFAAVNSDTATNLTGASPGAMVIFSATGAVLFGSAAAGGMYGNGVIFSVPTNGAAASVLHTFASLDSNTGTNVDGAAPAGGLVLSGNTLYGTASAGGAGGNGTIFSVDTNGNNFITLHSFSAMDPLTATNADGAMPVGGLVLSNGVLYGTTFAGGFGGSGVIFSINTNGSNFTVLHQLSAIDPSSKTNSDGAKPAANLLLNANTLYGTASSGGTAGSGTIFSLKTDGSQFQTLYSFSALNAGKGTNSDGAYPGGDLVVSGDSLYGTTGAGGAGAGGTVFSLPLPLPPAVITQIVHNPDGTVTLSFAGSPGSTNVIQSTADLTSGPWQPVSTNTADGSGFWQFMDSSANSLPIQFYRSYSE